MTSKNLAWSILGGYATRCTFVVHCVDNLSTPLSYRLMVVILQTNKCYFCPYANPVSILRLRRGEWLGRQWQDLNFFPMRHVPIISLVSDNCTTRRNCNTPIPSQNFFKRYLDRRGRYQILPVLPRSNVSIFFTVTRLVQDATYPLQKIRLREESITVHSVIQWIDESRLQWGEHECATAVATDDHASCQADTVREPLKRCIRWTAPSLSSTKTLLVPFEP